MAYFKANGTCSFFASFTPMVHALNVSTLEVDVRRLIGRRQSRFSGQNECIETDRTLRFASVQIVDHFLQMFSRLN